MKNLKFIIFILGLLCLSKTAMADTDIIQLPGTSHVYIGTGIDLGPLSMDGSFDTGFGSNYAGGSGMANPIAEFDFAAPIQITQLDFRMFVYGHEYGDDSGYITFEYYIQWYDGTIWREVVDGYTPGVSTDSHYYSVSSQYHDGMWRSMDSGHKTLKGLNLRNCSKIRVYAYSESHNNKNSNVDGAAYIYEIQALGNIDIGLRIYDGTNIIKIACEPVGGLTSPLKVTKNGITYSVILVEPSDLSASKIRIKTKSGIKALKKYN